MKVYRFIADSDEFSAIFPANSRVGKKFEALYDAKPLAEKWKPLEVVLDGVEGRLPDLACIDASFPAFSERAWKATESLIGSFVEALPIIHPSGESYFAVNVLNVVDALDAEKSKLKKYTSGKIMEIEKHVFRPEVITSSPIFRIPQLIGRIYYTDSFLAVVRQEKLAGLHVHPLR